MKKGSCTIVYFLTQSLFLGFGISQLYLLSGKDTYIGTILGIIIGFLIMEIYKYFIKQKKDMSLKDLFDNHPIIGMITRIILFLVSAFILLCVMDIFKLFVNSFLLINSPVTFCIVPFLILCSYSAYKGLTNIHRISSCLLPLSLILFILSGFSLFKSFSFDHFLPIFTTSPFQVLKTALTFAALSTFPNILSFHFNNKNIKNYSKMYLLSCIPILAIIIIINGVFGEVLIKVFRFPEYMVLKQLKLFDFIEKVENIMSIAWAFALFNTAIMAIYSMRETLPKKKNKMMIVLSLGILVYLLTKVFTKDYTNTIKLYFALPYIALGSIILFIILFFLLLRKPKHH